MEGTLNHTSMVDDTYLDLSDQPTLPPLCPLQKDNVRLRQLEIHVPNGKVGIVCLDNLTW